MTRAELRLYLDTWFCGCGNPEEAAGTLLRLLRLHPLYEHHAELEVWIPDMGVRMLLLYSLDRDGLTEHGGNVGGAWLTDKGQGVLDALAHEEALEAGGDRDARIDLQFRDLFGEYCVHGVDTDDQTHDCMAAER